MKIKSFFLPFIALLLTACGSGDGDNKSYPDRDLFNLRGDVAMLTTTRRSNMGETTQLYIFNRHGRLVAFSVDGRSNIYDADKKVSRDNHDRIDTIRQPQSESMCFYYDGTDTKPIKFKSWNPGLFSPDEAEEVPLTYDNGNMLIAIPELDYRVSDFDQQGNWLYVDCREYGETREIIYFNQADFEPGSPAAVVEEAMQYYARQDYDKYFDYTEAVFESKEARQKGCQLVAEQVRIITSRPQKSGGLIATYVYQVVPDKKNKDHVSVKYINVWGCGMVSLSSVEVTKHDGKWLMSIVKQPIT